MSIQKHFEKKESAVSPVVGVMLMLVVTIVVAAAVAMFAMGTFSEAQPGSTVVLKLDDYTMKLVEADPGEANHDTHTASFDSDVKESAKDVMNNYYGSCINYAPYIMKFRNMGGDTLSIDDLTLSITYNATTYKTPFNIVTKETTWSPGKVIELKARIADNCPNAAGVAQKVYIFGLSQQNMAGHWTMSSPNGPNVAPYVEAACDYFDWSILDRSGNVIAKGTEYFPEEVRETLTP